MPQLTIPQAIQLALQHHQAGHLQQAEEIYRQIIAVNPTLAIAYVNLGTLLHEKGSPTEAIAALEQAISLNPNIPQAHYNLGNIVRQFGRLDEAIAAFRRAISLNPNYVQAYSNLGNALRNTGQLDDAVASLRRALEIMPTASIAHSNLLFTLLYHPDYDDAAILAEARRWNDQHAQPLAHLIAPHLNDRSPDRALRIGYVSADFRIHASAMFLEPLLREHDRRLFEIFCYAEVEHPDDITTRLQAHADHWRSTVGLPDTDLAAQIRSDRIDILVDLKLHTHSNRLLVFARKPAPVQITWLGFPGTTGLAAIDYRLTDNYLDPPGSDPSYSERSIRLPHCFWCYDPLEKELPVNPLPAATNNHITFGCLNIAAKINTGVINLFSQILQATPNSRLLLLAPYGSFRQRVLDQFIQLAIDPNRIEFTPRLPRRHYLELYHRIDIALDPFPYNGHTTSLDALWMGVPVVTLRSPNKIVGRAGASQLSNLNLTELIANTPDQYLQIASTLANDLPRLAHLRATLRPRMQSSPLMDAPLFARNIESAYRDAWHSWCNTRSP